MHASVKHIVKEISEWFGVLPNVGYLGRHNACLALSLHDAAFNKAIQIYVANY